jgi:hypothetical protein
MDYEAAHYAIFSMICTNKYCGKNEYSKPLITQPPQFNYFPIATNCVPKIHINVILKYPPQSSPAYSHAQHLLYVYGPV